MRATREGLPGVPNPVDGRVDGDSPGTDAAAADACQRDPDQRPRARPSQMVQPLARIRFPDLRGGDTGHFRAYGNAAPVRHDRTAPGPICAGTLRTRLQGHDGCRNTAGNRLTPAVVALILPVHAAGTRLN